MLRSVQLGLNLKGGFVTHENFLATPLIYSLPRSCLLCTFYGAMFTAKMTIETPHALMVPMWTPCGTRKYKVQCEGTNTTLKLKTLVRTFWILQLIENGKLCTPTSQPTPRSNTAADVKSGCRGGGYLYLLTAESTKTKRLQSIFSC